MAKRI